MKAILWDVYSSQEIPRNSEAFADALSLDYFALKNGVETIKNLNLFPGQIPYNTGNTYTVWTSGEIPDQPEKIFSVHKASFKDIYDVLNHARKRNDSIIIYGADGADCVTKAARAARMIFPYAYIAPDAIHFDFPQSRTRLFLSKQAQEISFLQTVSLIGEPHA